MRTVRYLDHAVDMGFATSGARLVQALPYLPDTCTPGGQHAILQRVKILEVHGRNEPARGQAQEDAGRKIVPTQPSAELEILVEHFSKGEGDGLACISS